MGVLTLVDIDYGHIFGPFPSSLVMADPTYLIGMLTQDKQPETVLLKVDPHQNKEGARAIEWLAYIHPARNQEEQNMEAYMKGGLVYYRAIRIIRSREELFVWYSKDFTQIIGIPEVERKIMKDHEEYKCLQCGEVFENPFPLRAHIKFRCTAKTAAKIMDIASIDDYLQNNSQRLHFDNFKPNKTENISTKHEETDNSKIDISRKRHGQNTESINIKRKFEINENTLNTDHNQNVHIIATDAAGENLSAFRKVEKSNSLINKKNSPIDASISASSNLPPSIGLTFATHGMTTMFQSPPGLRSHPDHILSGQIGMLLPRMPLVNHIGMQSTPIPQSFMAESRQRAAMDAYRNGIQAEVRMQENISAGFALDNKNIMKKNIMFCDRPIIGFQPMKSYNPMVDKILQSPSPSIMNIPLSSPTVIQNWCAKCNASFRMTSDLVYHMRSHHKREFDPMKRKRDDKLKCSICNETFRERHHLTRHMTSHA